MAAFLQRPESYWGLAQAYGLQPGSEVAKVETHAAQVFLCGDLAVKIKRPVRYSFLDFSSAPKRRAALARELALNSRGAEELYLGLAAITGAAEGPLAFQPLRAGQKDPPGACDWALVMRCFDNDLRLDRLCERGGLDDKLLRQVVDQIYRYHQTAEVRFAPFGGASALEKIIQQNQSDFAQQPKLFDGQRIAALCARQNDSLAAAAARLDQRRTQGWVRRGHGDLHLGNLVIWRDQPVLFDAIEFDEEIGTEDLLYDLSFLLMDLIYRGRPALANQALNRYLSRQAGYDGLAALPLMLSLRASIRAKVAGFTAAQLDQEAQPRGPGAVERRKALDYLAQAERFLPPSGAAPAPRVRLLAVGGLSGSGKSSLAGMLAPELGEQQIGAVHLRSDMIRKRLMGVAPEAPLGPQAYDASVSRQVYATLFQEAEEALAAGFPVIADAVWARPAERDELARLASKPTMTWGQSPGDDSTAARPPTPCGRPPESC